jgi:hypothetical protein
MKRDFDLIRQILIKTEEESTPGNWYVPKIEGFDDLVIQHHIKLIGDKGYLDYYDASSKEGPSYKITGIKMQGYDYLDFIRQDTVWKKVKETVKSKSLDLSFDIIKSVAATVITGMLQ